MIKILVIYLIYNFVMNNKIYSLKIDTESYGKKFSVYPTLIKTDKDLILVDAGYSGYDNQISNELKKLGFTVKDLTIIVATHHDFDHIGSIPGLLQINNDIRVMASEIEKKWIEKTEKPLRQKNIELFYKNRESDSILKSMIDAIKKIPSIKISKSLSNNDYVSTNVRVVSTPGHTPGHISLYDETNRIFISGDSLSIDSRNNKINVIPKPATMNMIDAKNSIDNIITSLDIDELYCYHTDTEVHSKKDKKQIKEELSNIV